MDQAQVERVRDVEEHPRRIVSNIDTGLFISDLPSAEWIEMVDKLLVIVAAAFAQAAYHPDSISPPLHEALDKIGLGVKEI